MAKKRRTSLKELAAELGVSIATVSRALHASHEVSEEMQKRVKALAKARNYRPNPFAQSLRKEAPHIIGVIVPNLVTHYFASVLDGVEDCASKNGYSVFSANSHESHELEVKAVDNFYALHVDGIISCLAQDTTDYSHYEQMAKVDMPVVFFGRTCLPELFSQVVADGDVAAYNATKHMLEMGARRIAFIGGPSHLDMVKRRKHGYLEALREARIPIDRNLVVCDKIDFEVARKATIALLQQDERPDAILAFNDILTYAAFDAIKSQNLNIPDDVSIIGFTDGDNSAFVTPRLSAIMDQAHAQGYAACELLIRRIKGDRKIYKKIVPMILKFRESSEKNVTGGRKHGAFMPVT
ncbi:sugar-binding domain protein [Bacteroidales bacterium KA00344]|nr:sugar-binding domain protein [Bacteroidales bacterium KA00344]